MSRQIARNYGRIVFGHAEFAGAQLMQPAIEESERAARQVLQIG